MRPILCDVCGKYMEEGDLRYIEMYKSEEATEAVHNPVMPMMEICPGCALEIKVKISEIKNAKCSEHK